MKYNFNQKIDWGTIPPLEGDKGGGQTNTLKKRFLAEVLMSDVISTDAYLKRNDTKSLK
jgi:hypothetical protein